PQPRRSVSPYTTLFRSEETPGSIPNPVAKLDCADGTALGRVWESRSPPDIFVWGVGESLRGPCTGFLASPAPPFFMPRISTVRRRCAAEHRGVAWRWAMRCPPGPRTDVCRGMQPL